MDSLDEVVVGQSIFENMKNYTNFDEMEDDESHKTDEISIESIKEKLEEAQPLLTDKCCIHRVPHYIRKTNEDAYTPKVVSIGPFHHGDPNLLKMEPQKRLYCRQFIDRSEPKNLETFVSCVQQLEQQVRDCYSDDIKLKKEEHVMVILVDCCFILWILLKSHFHQWSSHDVSFRIPQLSTHLKYDLLLIENQVPFFVLEELYNLAFPSILNPSLLSLTRYILPKDAIFSGNVDVGRIVHFTDLARKHLLSSSALSISKCPRKAPVTHLDSATKLRDARVKFKVNEASKCLLDLQLSGHTLRIPLIRVEDFTEVVLRNLLAFEQYHYISESYLTDYIFVIDFLIDTDKDVDLLIKKGIIKNLLGDSNAVAKMFNGLGVSILISDFNTKYSNILENLNNFCQKPWNQKKASLMRDYCNTRWKTLASVGGIVLLCLTTVQTVFSILQVVLH